MSNQAYTDLENNYFDYTEIVEIIKGLAKQYPNDYDLGEAIRKFLKENNI